MVIGYNNKIEVVSPKRHFHGGSFKPNPTFGKPNSNPQQVHLHEKNDPTENQPPETPTKLWSMNGYSAKLSLITLNL